MVGNHIDAEEPYLEKLARGEANGDPCPDASRMRFWTMLYALLDHAAIPRKSIFVTNIHPALIADSDPTGVIDASEAWLDACRDLLRRQIAVMRPQAVAAMGIPAQRFMSRLLGVEWLEIPGYVTTAFDGHQLVAAGIRHPSAAQSLEGRDRTAQVLQDAMSERDG